MAPTDQGAAVSRGEFALFQSSCSERHRRSDDQLEGIAANLDGVRLDLATLRGSLGGATRLLTVIAALGSIGSCGVGVAGMVGQQRRAQQTDASPQQPAAQPSQPSAVSSVQHGGQQATDPSGPSSFWALPPQQQQRPE